MATTAVVRDRWRCGMKRTACRTDENQAEIVAGLRAVGVSVQPLHGIGKGCPALVCGCAGVNILLEVL